MPRKYIFLVITVTAFSLLIVASYLYYHILNETQYRFGLQDPVHAHKPLPEYSQHFLQKICQTWKDDSDNPTERTGRYPY
ncbi:hypothetical protein F5X99DRAFT_378773 [Biscogniauxia marginata]|nr:hypothetical protein F5X99DRAFT_378773 [Biscogniauxia marginata]